MHRCPAGSRLAGTSEAKYGPLLPRGVSSRAAPRRPILHRCGDRGLPRAHGTDPPTPLRRLRNPASQDSPVAGARLCGRTSGRMEPSAIRRCRPGPGVLPPGELPQADAPVSRTHSLGDPGARRDPLCGRRCRPDSRKSAGDVAVVEAAARFARSHVTGWFPSPQSPSVVERWSSQGEPQGFGIPGRRDVEDEPDKTAARDSGGRPGQVWIQEFDGASHPLGYGRFWRTVTFDRGSVTFSRVVFPADFQPHRISASRALGVVVDPEGCQHVATVSLQSLSRQGPQPDTRSTATYSTVAHDGGEPQP